MIGSKKKSKNPFNEMADFTQTPDRLPALFREYFEQFESTLNGDKHAPIPTLRKEAFQRFHSTGFPSSRNEEYKYTPISGRLSAEIFSGEAGHEVPDPEFIRANIIDDPEVENIVFIDGIPDLLRSPALTNSVGIEIQTLDKAFQAKSPVLTEMLRAELDKGPDPFNSLNLAMAHTGLYIKVPENLIVKKPIIVYHFSSGQSKLVNSRNVIIAGKNSEFRLAHFYISKENTSFFENVNTSIYIEENARVHFKKIDKTGKGVHFGQTFVHQEKNSFFNGHAITLSGALTRNNVNVSLDGEQCESHLYGLYFVKGSDHVDNHTVVDHRKPHCFSNEFYKGILDERSTGVFNGKIFVQPGAQKTNAFQSNRNIVLSDQATINTKPQLEIWADDVKCSHGATIGKLDENQLFYLRSRGMNETSAKALMIYAFANELLEKMTIDPLKVSIEKTIQERLGQNFVF